MSGDIELVMLRLPEKTDIRFRPNDIETRYSAKDIKVGWNKIKTVILFSI